MIRTLHLFGLLLLGSRLFAFNVQTIVQHATCGNTIGSITAYPLGGTAPYTYLWNDGSTNSQLIQAPPGTYTVTITDSEGETGIATAEIIATTALFPPMGPGIEIWSCDPGCQGSVYQYNLNITGTTPFEITCDPPGPTPWVNPNGLGVYGLCPGYTYNLTVVDGEGCTGVYGPIVTVPQPGPNILAVSSTPSCPGGATGSLTVLYDDIDSLYVIGPGQTWFLPTTNPFTLTNLAPGDYYLNGTVIPEGTPPGVYTTTCYVVDTLTVGETSEPCGTLSGTVFADVDDDCAQTGPEPGLQYRVLSVEPGGHLVMTGADGAYSTQYFYGGYSLSATIDGYASDCVTLPAAFTLDTGTPTAEVDLPMSPTFGPDLSVNVYLGAAVPGFEHGESVVVSNEGPFTFTGITVDLEHDALLSFLTSDVMPDLVETGHLQWDLVTVAPFSTITLFPEFLVPADAGLIGTVLTSDASITLDTPDSNTDNDTDQASRTITGGFDPNDKLAETSSRLSGTSYYLDQDQFVDYTIRFQNTGTGPAYNVYLLDTISSLLDLTSFSIIASSHTFEASLGNDRALRFDFPNIMLPDSGSDMSGSQGFISFRLRPVSGLAVGQQLVNASDIFFDFNEPIRTNDAVLDVEQSTGMSEIGTVALVVYPNPVTDLLRIDLENGASRMDVIAADGRVIQSQRAIAGTNQFDTRALMPGAYSIRVLSTTGAVQHARFVKR